MMAVGWTLPLTSCTGDLSFLTCKVGIIGLNKVVVRSQSVGMWEELSIASVGCKSAAILRCCDCAGRGQC